MEWRKTALKIRLYVMAAIILLLGSSIAAVIYAAAENGSKNMLVYQLENSKMYRHNLEVFGGKYSVIVDEFLRWFDGLWHGKSLAYTVIWITLAVFLALVIAAYNVSPQLTGISGEEGNDGN